MSSFSVSALVSSTLHAVGGGWLAIEAGSFFRPTLADAARDHWWVLVVAGLVFVLVRCWPRLAVCARIADTDTSVEIRVCDLFSQAGSVVLGSNTTFDTTTEDGTISPSSTQGQFTLRFCDSLENLDRQLEDSLTSVSAVSLDAEGKPYGKRASYPVGTVASAICNGRRAYFLAIARLNAHRVASASWDDVLDALPRLWESIRSRGGIEPVVVPVLGSGFSRIDGTREELIREIVKSFIAASRAGYFCEQLTIAIAPQDYRRGHLDLRGLGSFLEHECRYAGRRQPTTPHGAPAQPLESETS